MNLSDQDRERLDELARMRDNGEISNEEYQRLCWATLAEKNRRGSNPPRPEPPAPPAVNDSQRAVSELIGQPSAPVQPRLAPDGKPASLMDLTTCNPSRSNARQPRLRRAATGLNPNISMTSLFRLKSSRTTAGHAMLFPRQGLSLFSMFLILVISTVVTIIVAGRVLNRPAPPPAPPPGVVENASRDFIRPVFGAIAVSQCKERCSAQQTPDARSACDQSCRYLSLSNFGRRITLRTKLDPRADAAEISGRCTRDPIEQARYREPGKWERSIRDAAGILQTLPKNARLTNIDQAQKAFDDLYRANRGLMMPAEQERGANEAEERALTEAAVRTTCMRANVVLVEMALLKAAETGDSFSERHFAEMHPLLAGKSQEMESSLLSQPKIKELLGNVPATVR